MSAFSDDNTHDINLHGDFISFCHSHDATNRLPEIITGTPPTVSVRVNSRKNVTVPDGASQVPWCHQGFYIDRRPAFTFDPALHQGLYYVQDASSMVLGHVVAQLSQGMTAPVYLDACAAPGGKTTAAIDALPAGAVVVANEYDPHRAAALKQNMMRWGYPATIVRCGDTSVFATLPATFDIIAADVPCSGEGMMRKDPAAVAQWSPALVRQCAALQRSIVANLWPALRPGGVLIYSTCTFNAAENEDNISHFISHLGAESIDLHLNSFPGVTQALTPGCQHHCYHFIPGLIRGEGLFIAALRKPDDNTEPARRKPNKTDKRTHTAPAQLTPLSKKIYDTVIRWLNGEHTLYTAPAGQIIAYPAGQNQIMSTLTTALGGILSAGIDMATIKGRDIIPTHALALSIAVNAEAFPACHVDYHDAITYLQRNTLNLPATTPRGPVLLTYNHHPLGFMKNLGNRANTLLPQSHRILTPTIPTDPPSII